MTVVSKNVCIGKIDDIIDKYNNTYHKKFKTKLIDDKASRYIDFENIDVENSHEDPKFGELVRISKYRSIFWKGYTPNWSEEVFVIIEVRNAVLWTYGISDLNGEEIGGAFYDEELQKSKSELG